MRRIAIILAAFCATPVFDAHAVPVSVTSTRSGLHSIWTNSASSNLYDDFVLADSRSVTAIFSQFDASLGTLLNAQLTLTSQTSHPTRTLFLPEVSGLPIELQLGAIAQDTERDLHGTFNLWAYYDARVSYRADYRLTVDPLNTDLFAPIAAEAAFGSCQQIEDLFLDIGNTNPSCTAGNNGSPLTGFNYIWGPLAGSSLAQFIGTGDLLFDTRMTGDAYGACDDDIGDYCRLNLAMIWDWDLSLTYTYEPGTPGNGGDNGGSGGNGGNPVPVPEPGTTSLLSFVLLAFALNRKRFGQQRTRIS